MFLFASVCFDSRLPACCFHSIQDAGAKVGPDANLLSQKSVILTISYLSTKKDQ